MSMQGYTPDGLEDRANSATFGSHQDVYVWRRRTEDLNRNEHEYGGMMFFCIRCWPLFIFIQLSVTVLGKVECGGWVDGPSLYLVSLPG